MHWHPFRQPSALPARLLDGMRRWPLYSGYANAFCGAGLRRRSRTGSEPRLGSQLRNTSIAESTISPPAGPQGSLPRIDPVDELFILSNFLNAALAFAVGVLALAAARLAGLGDQSWYPVLFLSFSPGYALSLVRVSN